MQKRISILLGIISIAIAIIIIVGGVFAYQYFSKSKITSVNEDKSCNGENNPDYDFGFGIEHKYDLLLNEGDSDRAMSINIILSCDHKKISISGAINQKILSSDLAEYYNGENIDLIYPEGIDNNISSDDYNSDGYDDLAVVYSRGNGISAVEYDLFFIYNPKNNKFIYNSQLSELENISVETLDHIITQYFDKGYDQKTGGNFGFEEITYKWNNDLLVKISDKKCEIVQARSSKEVSYYRNIIVNFSNDGSEQVVLDEVKKMGEGSCFDTYYINI